MITNTEKETSKPVILLMIDGWGVAQNSEYNAIEGANKPFFSDLISQYPVAVLNTGEGNNICKYLTISSGIDTTNESEIMDNNLANILSKQGLKQLRIAEAEGYSFITDFFNTNTATIYDGQDNILIQSDIIDTEKINIGMGLDKVIKQLIKSIKNDDYDFILANISNLNVLSRVADKETLIKTVELIDKYIGKLVKIVSEKEGVLIISSPYGNVERIVDQTELKDVESTNNPVPFIIVGEEFKGKAIGQDPLNQDLSILEPAGDLKDIAPTILKIMNINESLGNGKSLI